MDNLTRRRLATRAVHSGLRPSQGDFVSTVVPIYQSSTFSYRRLQDLDGVFAGTRSGYVYARYGNPTVAALEGAIALLEEGEAALAFASGMAAIHAALLAIGARAGSAIVAAQDIYGATYTLLAELLSSQGVQVRFVDINDLDAVSLACSELRPVALIAESISNPLLKIADVPALAEIAHRCNATLLVDNTFATPTLIQPLTLGADMVIHSVTKYLGGHGDVLGGAVVASSERVEALQKVLKLTGGNLGPQDAWLVLRGIRTLPLRMRQHCENALQLARWLETQDQIERVIYPGLPSHPQHALANRLFGDRGYGGMLSFELTGAGQEDVFRFFETLQLCIPATSLGDTCSLMLYPAHSSHRSLTPEARAHIGISEGLVRMSVGIEAISDLQEDLSQSLKAYRNALRHVLDPSHIGSLWRRLMKRNYVRQVVNIASTLLVLVVNFLANALPLNGKNTGEISDQFDVYFVPAGYVFSIWGLIYVGLIAFTIYQALPSQWDNARLKRIGYLYPLSCLANAAWIFLWHYERFPLTLVAMLILLLALIAIYVRLHIGREAFTFSETWLIRIPFSLYLGWITVATIANVTSLLDFLGWGGWGIAPEIWAVIMLIAATGIASLVSISRGDIPYMLVIIWAFVGIAVKHAATPTVAIAAWVTTGINAAMMVVGALLHRRR